MHTNSSLASIFPQVDLVLTTAEVIEMLEEAAKNTGMEPAAFFLALPVAALNSEPGSVGHLLNMGIGSPHASQLLGAATSGAGSGGFIEYVFRCAAADLFGITIAPDEKLVYTQGRNDDFKELKLERDGHVRPAACPARQRH